MPLSADLLRLLTTVNARTREDVSLAAVAALAHRSRFDLHRRFRAAVGETPRTYTSRVRLSRAAAELLGGRQPIAALARAHGFAAHETFTRAFTRRFGLAPRHYRARGLHPGGHAVAAVHAEAVTRAAPCIGLYRAAIISTEPHDEEHRHMNSTVSVREEQAVHALVVRRRVTRDGIPAALAETLPQVFEHALGNGLAMSGPPFTRYVEIGMGTVLIEGGVPLAAPPTGDLPEGVTAVTLPAGPAAVAVHVGPYETLTETYGVLESWLAAEGRVASGPPWETYLTDPGENPDPATWRTEVVQPVGPPAG
ncbi:helix-turn-helix domain-containing protein [Pseudonocardia sp. NPDC046786]|uniref:helix-turn-helix domain-containing protein n=1 Tax=Pseudonocardia sp. NPDC046786 TaxID=3155471 RepID=UPI0033E4FC22